MIYTDGIHLITDGELKELHDFAQSIGIKSCWFHNPRGKNKPHYDLKPHQHKIAVHFGAIEKTSKELVTILKSK
jgi:hypothetical protein